MPDFAREEKLRAEFNLWAEAGRGEGMERDHRRIAEQTLERMAIQPYDRILDLSCGAGWLAGELARRVPEGQVVGLDLAEEMIRRARTRFREQANLMFVIAGVDEIPWDDDFFNHVISVEAFYYYPDQPRALAEVLRVLRPGGTAWFLINLYRENVYSHGWADKLGVPVWIRSGDDYCEMMRGVGFVATGHRRIIDDTPLPESYSGKWFKDLEEVKNFRAEGALLFYGTKPALEPRTQPGRTPEH